MFDLAETTGIRLDKYNAQIAGFAQDVSELHDEQLVQFHNNARERCDLLSNLGMDIAPADRIAERVLLDEGVERDTIDIDGSGRLKAIGDYE